MLKKFKIESSKTADAKESIRRTLEIADHYAGEISIEVLPLEKIELDPENNRELVLTLQDAVNGIDAGDPEFEKKSKDWKSLETLAQTIKTDQLINPIYVYRYGNKCRLIAGERRTLASAIAGKKEIIARIAGERPIGTKLKILQWVENNERSDLTLSERIASLEAIIKEYSHENLEESGKKITAQLLSDLTGMSPTQARRYNLILNAKPHIKSAVFQGKLENVKILELICSTDNLEHQEVLLNAAVSNLSFNSIVKLKKDLENKGTNEKTKGRKKENISIGKIKPNIAKIIFDALMSSHILETNLSKKINLIHNDIKWSDSKSIENSFKDLLSILDKVESKA